MLVNSAVMYQLWSKLALSEVARTDFWLGNRRVPALYL